MKNNVNDVHIISIALDHLTRKHYHNTGSNPSLNNLYFVRITPLHALEIIPV